MPVVKIDLRFLIKVEIWTAKVDKQVIDTCRSRQIDPKQPISLAIKMMAKKRSIMKTNTKD